LRLRERERAGDPAIGLEARLAWAWWALAGIVASLGEWSRSSGFRRLPGLNFARKRRRNGVLFLKAFGVIGAWKRGKMARDPLGVPRKGVSALFLALGALFL
jgi:hypothetical protein